MIPQGIYCYDENGVCPYYMKLGTITWSKNPVESELLCKYHSQCSECTKCQSQVIRCEKLDFTDFDESTLLWDKCKECSFNYDSDEKLTEHNLVDRSLQEVFGKLLSCGFDSYGRVEDEELEKKYLQIKVNIEHIHYFDNGTFMLNPYYWGDDDDLIDFPNFIYYPTGLELSWYKYPLRACCSNRPIGAEEFEEMINDCIRSLEG